MNYRNVDLSELSCYAAGEIGNSILGRGRECGAVEELALRMKKLSEQDIEEMDPSEILIYYEVFRERHEDIEQVYDLKSKIFLKSKGLRNILENGKEEREELKGFCIDVSRWAMAYESGCGKSSLVA